MAQGWTAACERQAKNLERHPDIADWLLNSEDSWAKAMRSGVRKWGTMTDRQLRASRRAAGVDKVSSLG